MNKILVIVLIAFVLAIATQVVNKLMINEKKTEENNKKMKELQKNLRGMDPKSKDFAKDQEEFLNINLSNMKQQFKPLIITIVPFIIVIQLLGMTYSFIPIDYNSEVKIEISGNGEVYLPCLGVNETVLKSFSTTGIYTEECNGLIDGIDTRIELFGINKIETYNAGDMKVTVTPPKLVFLNLPFSLPFIGNQIGWLGTYIMFSLMFSMTLNRALKGIHFRKWG